MATGTPVILVLLLMGMVFTEKYLPSVSSLSKSRNFTGVQVTGGYIELVEEETCSKGVIRLTCRSLRAFLLVLEANYLSNRSNLCGDDDNIRDEKRKDVKNGLIHLRGNYIDDDNKVEEPPGFSDLRSSLNRRCSGLQHCRFNMNLDHPEATFWFPATSIRLKYACIPESAISKYCNTKLLVLGGEGGYLKSPGYPHYYLGGNSCGWTFQSQPGQRISLTLHDLDIRNAQQDGSCVDVIRVRENGITLLESCGTLAGVQVLSESNLVTLDLIALGNLYPSRGFLLQYQAVGCPEIDTPKGSYLINDTGTEKTFLCRSGSVFSDTKIRRKLIRCKNGLWNEDIVSQSCINSSAGIIKAERETGKYTASLSEESEVGGTIYVPVSGIVGRSSDANAMPGSLDNTMEAGPPWKQGGDYVVDIILPSVFIALLFIGNAIIVYVIFQYRKRKQPGFGRGRGEEMALRNPTTEDLPQV